MSWKRNFEQKLSSNIRKKVKLSKTNNYEIFITNDLLNLIISYLGSPHSLILINKNHKLISVLQYNIDLEPEDVLNYLKYKEKYNFLTIVSKISDILWNDTISIFKNLNSLHIVYYEEPTKKSSNTKKVYIRNAKLKRNKHTRKRT